jgi:hypothetical protein
MEGMDIGETTLPIRAMALWESTSTLLDKMIPKESLTLDCAMLLRNVDYEWSATAPSAGGL